MFIRLLLLVEFKSPRATINALFNSEANKQEITPINQCAILKSVGKVGDRMIQNASIFLFFFHLLGWIDNNDLIQSMRLASRYSPPSLHSTLFRYVGSLRGSTKFGKS